jgi:hypothetical protein
MSEDPPRPAGIYAYGDGAEIAPGDSPFDLHEGDVIKLMAEDDVDCPLWHAGLLFSDAEEFIDFGAPPELARDLAAWAEQRQRQGRTEHSDLEALKLLDRLTSAFDRR